MPSAHPGTARAAFGPRPCYGPAPMRGGLPLGVFPAAAVLRPGGCGAPRRPDAGANRGVAAVARPLAHPAAVARGSPVVGELSPEVTEGLKALRYGKAFAFLLALNDGRNRRGRKGRGSPDSQAFNPSVALRAPAPFTQGSLWRPLSRLMLYPGVAFFVTKTISTPRCAGPRAARAPASVIGRCVGAWLRPQARFGAQPPLAAALSAEMGQDAPHFKINTSAIPQGGFAEVSAASGG